MQSTRRDLLKTAAFAAGALSLTAAARAQDTPTGAFMTPLDYGRSFLCNTADFNRVRFWIESRTRIIDDERGTTTDYWQCASCKSENTFGEKDLFYEDNYDFLPIWNGSQWLVFRSTVRLSESYRITAGPDKYWGTPVLKVREAPKVTVLDTWEAIRDTTADAVPIVTQTELTNPDLKLRAIIECPCKTMNVSLPKVMYQVDTGPIAYPDLSKRYDNEIDCVSKAFIAFNAPHFADFVIEQPTPIDSDNPDSAQTYHYSGPISLAAKNLVLALPD